MSYFRMHFKRGTEITSEDVFKTTESYLDIIENSARGKRDFISSSAEAVVQTGITVEDSEVPPVNAVSTADAEEEFGF